MKRANLRLVLAGSLLVVLSAAAVLAPWLAPDPPLEMGSALLAGPSPAHPLGTDSFGRDTLSRLLYGARVSLAVSLLSVLIASPAARCSGWPARRIAAGSSGRRCASSI